MTTTFTLHIPPDLHERTPAVGDEDQDSLFPHTPRLDDRCFDTSVSEILSEI